MYCFVVYHVSLLFPSPSPFTISSSPDELFLVPFHTFPGLSSSFPPFSSPSLGVVYVAQIVLQEASVLKNSSVEQRAKNKLDTMWIAFFFIQSEFFWFLFLICQIRSECLSNLGANIDHIVVFFHNSNQTGNKKAEGLVKHHQRHIGCRS